MKTTPHTSQPLARRGRGAMPRIEYSFQADSRHDFGPRAGKSQPSFRDLSGGYFNYEAPRAFATEAALFGVILLTVIVPLINSASAVMDLVRAFNF
ncbi:MAG: hypothetical protein ACJ8KU_11640 [Chthoniobacterales bacterium]